MPWLLSLIHAYVSNDKETQPESDNPEKTAALSFDQARVLVLSAPFLFVWIKPAGRIVREQAGFARLV